MKNSVDITASIGADGKNPLELDSPSDSENTASYINDRRRAFGAGDGLKEEINQPEINPLELGASSSVRRLRLREEINQFQINPLELESGRVASGAVLEEINQPEINPLELEETPGTASGAVLEEINQPEINPLELEEPPGAAPSPLNHEEINQSEINLLELRTGDCDRGEPPLREGITQFQINPLELGSGSVLGGTVLEEITQPEINPLELEEDLCGECSPPVLEEINLRDGFNPLELDSPSDSEDKASCITDRRRAFGAGDGLREETKQPEINPLELETGSVAGGAVLEEINQFQINPLELGALPGEEYPPPVLEEINQAGDGLREEINLADGFNPLELNSPSQQENTASDISNRPDDPQPGDGLREEINQPLVNPLEKKRRGARGKSHPSGCLYPYLKNKKLKNGRVATYPPVEGRRDPFNDAHWYWAYNYEEKEDGDWRNRSLPVPRFRVRPVRQMIDNGAHVSAIKALIKGEFSH